MRGGTASSKEQTSITPSKLQHTIGQLHIFNLKYNIKRNNRDNTTIFLHKVVIFSGRYVKNTFYSMLRTLHLVVCTWPPEEISIGLKERWWSDVDHLVCQSSGYVPMEEDLCFTHYLPGMWSLSI